MGLFRLFLVDKRLGSVEGLPNLLELVLHLQLPEQAGTFRGASSSTAYVFLFIHLLHCFSIPVVIFLRIRTHFRPPFRLTGATAIGHLSLAIA